MNVFLIKMDTLLVCQCPFQGFFMQFSVVSQQEKNNLEIDLNYKLKTLQQRLDQEHIEHSVTRAQLTDKYESIEEAKSAAMHGISEPVLEHTLPTTTICLLFLSVSLLSPTPPVPLIPRGHWLDGAEFRECTRLPSMWHVETLPPLRIKCWTTSQLPKTEMTETSTVLSNIYLSSSSCSSPDLFNVVYLK